MLNSDGGVRGVVGNIKIVLVMIGIAHRNRESDMLRFSLTLSDLVITVFVVSPHLYYHVEPFLTYTELLPIETTIKGSENLTAVDFIVYVEKGYRLFQALFFTSC